ncbi:MAG: hypothetical protein KC621_29815, partial [Myxococcales bacterium]|nr:hypothetical protein [Myxococcales bacterium]
IVNPISIKEALLAPFRKIGETIQQTLDKASASQTTAMSGSVTQNVTAAADKAASAPTSTVAAGEAAKAAKAADVAKAVAPAPAPAPDAAAAPAAPPAEAPSAMGNLPLLAAGVGIALGAIGAFVTAALSALFSATATVSTGIASMAAGAGLPEGASGMVTAVSYPFALILVILGVVLVPFLIYAVPVSLATWFRLRRRDLATLLEGSGWAINTRLYLDRDLAVQLTTRPSLPR